jgi:hypothetical protein
MRRAHLAVLLALACAGPPQAPAPGTSQAWGQLRLVPRDGVAPARPGNASYGDRRLRDVEFVDYSRPGFAVVYVEEASPPGGELELAIRESRLGTRVEPAIGAIGASGRLVVRNESRIAHVISYPAAGAVLSLGPGERVELRVPRAGEQGLFLLDASAAATIFAAPGPYVVVSSTGRFSLSDLTPGRRELRVWHPRFPPTVRSVELAPDARVQVDLELGVGRGGKPGHAH